MVDNLAVRDCVRELEQTLVRQGARPATVQKYNNVLIELMQNILYHNLFDVEAADALLPSVTVFKIEKGVAFEARNLVNVRQRAKLQTYLSSINQMDKDTLRARYKEVMADGEFSEDGTAGMGFLDMARKARDNQLAFDFETIDNERSWFTLRIEV